MKKMMLLAVMALVAVMAVPALASANWKDKGADFVGSKAIPTTGSAAFTSEFGGINCTSGAKGSFTIVGGTTTGTVTSFAPDVTKCDGTGLLAGCTLTNVTPTGLPWTIHNNAGVNVSITGVHIDNTLTGFFCPSKSITLGVGNITATPDPNVTAITSLTLSGTLPSTLGGNVTVTGTLTPSNASDLGTYGLK